MLYQKIKLLGCIPWFKRLNYTEALKHVNRMGELAVFVRHHSDKVHSRPVMCDMRIHNKCKCIGCGWCGPVPECTPVQDCECVTDSNLKFFTCPECHADIRYYWFEEGVV